MGTKNEIILNLVSGACQDHRITGTVFAGDESVNAMRREIGSARFEKIERKQGRLNERRFKAIADKSVTGKGNFDVILTDYDSEIVPAPEYHVKGTFNFKMGKLGSVPFISPSE